jgi:hypothetical protein
MAIFRMYCPDCGTDLTDIPLGDPCPSCSGPNRVTHATVESVDCIATVEEVSLNITRDDHRPWSEKWLETLRCLRALEAAYTGTEGLNNDEIDDRCLSFFVACDHVRDWLAGDTPPGVTTDDIEQHFMSSEALQRCNAVCNTHKHHTRRSGTTARIRETSITPSGNRVTIEIDWATSNRTTVDALDLANGCLESWRAFFTKFSVTEP